MSNDLSKTDIMDNVIKLINGVGFPIVVSMALFWFNIQSLDNQSQLIAEFDSTMKGNRILLEKLASESAERQVLAKIIIDDLDDIKKDTMK